MRTRTLKIGLASLALFGAASLATAASAQMGGALDPRGGNLDSGPAINTVTAAPQPSFKTRYPVWLGLASAVIMAGVVMTVSLIPAKRSHQD
ncbi:MAG: hypothetical protein HRU76_04475 [Phycisphaeraceae bacterium]|nr:hypothetical protein [Phycisphaerales bacterium]QOJ16888.1 MAG: hypothetical protein HRU76_04475 [Phycisphaeraceae bacterium]